MGMTVPSTMSHYQKGAEDHREIKKIIEDFGSSTVTNKRTISTMDKYANVNNNNIYLPDQQAFMLQSKSND